MRSSSSVILTLTLLQRVHHVAEVVVRHSTNDPCVVAEGNTRQLANVVEVDPAALIMGHLLAIVVGDRDIAIREDEDLIHLPSRNGVSLLLCRAPPVAIAWGLVLAFPVRRIAGHLHYVRDGLVVVIALSVVTPEAFLGNELQFILFDKVVVEAGVIPTNGVELPLVGMVPMALDHSFPFHDLMLDVVILVELHPFFLST